MPLALITDCEGPVLSDEEAAFFKEAQPFGFILFQRHCESPKQVQKLVKSLKACVNHDAPILIDQEGGRVARLKPPEWEAYPPAGNFARLAEQDAFAAEQASYLNARLIANDLHRMGINVNCTPLLDLNHEGAHDIIGDRAFGSEPGQVIGLARAHIWGLMDGGVLPVIKHIPGHGRALADSHESLPTLDASREELEQSDFVPFKAFANMPFAMTAHITYNALDDMPATLSKPTVDYIRNEIGFEHLLMSDDLSMKALSGDLAELATQTLDSGCDLVLHCNGTLDERQQVAKGCRELPADRYDLYEMAAGAIAEVEKVNRNQLRAERDMHLEMLAL